MRIIYLCIMFLTLGLIAACVEPEASTGGNTELDKGGDKDSTCESITIEVTDKVPQLPDCYATGKICKWKARITFCRYHAYIWGTGTWEKDWTYSVSVQFVAIGCDGKTKAVYNGTFPPQKEPGIGGLIGMAQQLMDWIKNGAHFVDAMVGPVIEGPNDADYYNFPLHDDKGCWLKREDAEAHFDALLTWLIGVVKNQTNKAATTDTEEPSKLLLDADAAYDLVYGALAFERGNLAATESEQNQWADIAAAWMMNGFDRVNGITPTQPVNEFVTPPADPETCMTGTGATACTCAVSTNTVAE
jgi:hypothetical protein